jgi:predicted PurR-regulated permease PerM
VNDEIETKVEEPNMPKEESPQWDRSIKILVAVVSLILIIFLASRFTDLILRIIAAGIIAYVLTPLINFLVENTPLKRGSAILLTYFVLAIVLIGAAINLGVSTFKQVSNLIESVPDLLNNVVDWLTTTEVIVIGPFDFQLSTVWGNIDWDALGDQIIATVVPILNQSGRTVVIILSSTAEVLTTILFISIISIYLAFEMGRLGGYISNSVYQPGYRRDTERMLREFDRIWRAYLRGQILLAGVIFLAVWVALSILGVQNAFGLGVLSGLLEFLPVIGPFIGTAAAVLVAFFQPDNYLGIDPVYYALLVLGVMMLIQQVENNLLVPRIVGGALDLHALIVIIGVFMGATMAGLIGAILAAPIVASTKLLGTYAWRKMFDLPPFPEQEMDKPAPRESMIFRFKRWWKSKRNTEADKVGPS